MIVVGVDVHKHALTAVAVDEVGRPLAVDDGVIPWAQELGGERLWALEDCRHGTGRLERALVAAGEALVWVPPRLTGPQRRRSRTRGKSDGKVGRDRCGRGSRGQRCRSRSWMAPGRARRHCGN